VVKNGSVSVAPGCGTSDSGDKTCWEFGNGLGLVDPGAGTGID
jgi:hypothetical protein